MKRWVEFAASLYPRKWRERYGEEFHALLMDVNPGWRDLLNVLAGALQMQLMTRSIYLRFSVAAAVLGAIGATAASFAVPKVYISSAVLRITSVPGSRTGTPVRLDEQFLLATQDVMSQASLSELMQRPALNLYPKERQKEPLEDVIETMRRDVRISRVSSDSSALVLRVQSAYPDQRKAQAFNISLMSRLVESFASRMAADARTRATLRSGENLEVIEPATLPDHGTRPHLPFYAAAGLGIGLVFGLVAAFYVKHRRRTLLIVGCGLAGCILGGAISILVPNRYASRAVIRLLPSDQLTNEEASAWVRRTVEGVQNEPMISAIMKQNRENGIQLLGKEHERPRAATVMISVASRDRFQAQKMVQAIAVQFRQTEGRHVAGQLEFLDQPSFPQAPVFPNRLVISLMGLAAGLTIGTAALWFRQRRHGLAAPLAGSIF